MQSVDYTYNIRGWLTSINNPDDLSGDLFGERLLYESTESGLNSQQFNGNISGMVWNSTQKSKQGYGFTYDGLNRLTLGDHKDYNYGWSDNNNYEEKSLAYDMNGNIKRLIRTNSSGGYQDDFTYNYSGNKLSSINSGAAYTYDQNGNTTTDGLRGVSIAYNVLNLPKSVSKGSENILYIYSALGEKLAKKMTNNTYQYYAGNVIYNNDKSLNYLLFDEGLVTKTSAVYSYEYHLKDHPPKVGQVLGNTRVTFQSNGSTTTTTQVAEYYPFGSSYLPVSPAGTNKYLYNGKEKQDDALSGTALDWYDYGARFYDPAIARWHVQDPRAEKYFSYSPYNYCINNPLNFVDPRGDTVKFVGAAEEAAYNDYKNTVNSRVQAYDKRIQNLRDKGKTERADKRDTKRSDNVYVQIQGELGAAESNENVFKVRVGSNISDPAGAGNVTYNKSTSEIDVNISSGGGWTTMQKVSHEFKHVDQFINLELDLNPDGGELLYDKTDEVAAFERQNLFGTTVDAKSFVIENYSTRREGPKSFHLLTPTEQTQYKTK